jgi:FkbM family methyltransferase
MSNIKHDGGWFSKNKESLKVIRDLIPESKCIFEIGAFDGIDIEIIKELWGDNVDIHAFEPSPDNFLALKNLYGESKNVTCNELALTNFDGTTDFYLSHDPRVNDQKDRNLWYKTASSLRPHSNRHKETQNFYVEEEKITVSCMKIDTYCEKRGIRPDIMFLDTQGSEYEILEGAKKTLKYVKGLILEYSIVPLYEGQYLLPEIVNFLTKEGFEEYKRVDLYASIHGEVYFIKKLK